MRRPLSFIGKASGLLHCPNNLQAIVPALCISTRSVASYPSPGTDRGKVKINRKKYNFLNSERLMKTNKEPRSRREVRIRDDVFFHRRIQYRQAIGTNVEKHIRYLPDNVKQYVFFKNKVNSLVSTGFHGARKAPGIVARRIVLMVENEILKPENRDHLVELIESVGVEPPTKEEWDRYTNKKTGRININLYYHANVEKHLRQFFTAKVGGSFRLLQAFMVLKRNDFSVCPPMYEWALRQGPIRNEELVERSEVKEQRDVIGELAKFQRPHIDRAFKKLTNQAKQKCLKEAEDNEDQLRREYEQERVFAAKVLSGVAALKEVRAMTSPALTYYRHEHYKYVIKKNGSVDATLRRSRDESPSWHMIPKEEQVKFYCFERTMQMHPVGGAHLFIRYACRDYGLTREEAMLRWSFLSDLQKAALSFCFYAPISASNHSGVAFRRFYWKQCYIHGLMMTGKACGNRAFFERMRKVWMGMSADERAQYEETDSFSSVFPLHRQSASSVERDGTVSVSESKVSDSIFSMQSSSRACSTVNGTSRATPTLERNGSTPTDEEDDKELLYFEDEVIEGDDEDDKSGGDSHRVNGGPTATRRCEEVRAVEPYIEEAVAFSI
ncbi:hypothetical protein, conserved [Trypanosoma brucei gambiense DAL972]|uniref:Uncharacterized protein n=2 Tax=Trypanosoma brucei TaxID=5691 RepID=D0A7W0_TRYB9|nr:hypothetical protein, conserved [Trypanosoma brucei gambiense DAL972]RHW67204.1 hypothetical protein DPX39_000026500 [Trypanosoma brucei equiperdum]CBH17761.1 hypothetical protein, conserved [Trypanosoma brucei gambiense DAL972]|eukprot:XP_011780025.1 hypothetical protein, conserved [Trypanosoma brucei gambiense DAL972]